MSTIKVCYENGYSLAQIAAAFNKSMLEVCQELDYPVKLDKIAWNEICAEFPDLPVRDLASLYNTSIDIIYGLNYGKTLTNGRTKVTRSDIMDAVAKYGNEQIAAENLGISLKTLHKRMKLHTRTFPSADNVRNFNGTQEEAALHFNVSRAWICKHAPSGKTKNSKPNKIKDWEEVLSYLESNSLAATAKKFGVSSSAITQWKQRNGL